MALATQLIRAVPKLSVSGLHKVVSAWKDEQVSNLGAGMQTLALVPRDIQTQLQVSRHAQMRSTPARERAAGRARRTPAVRGMRLFRESGGFAKTRAPGWVAGLRLVAWRRRAIPRGSAAAPWAAATGGGCRRKRETRNTFRQNNLPPDDLCDDITGSGQDVREETSYLR